MQLDFVVHFAHATMASNYNRILLMLKSVNGLDTRVSRESMVTTLKGCDISNAIFIASHGEE